MTPIYTCSFKGMTRKYLGHRFKNYQHRKRHFNEPMQETVYIFRHRTCCFMQINQFYVRPFGSFCWCMLHTVIILDTMRHLPWLCWMVRHLGWSAPLPKTADPKLDTDSEKASGSSVVGQWDGSFEYPKHKTCFGWEIKKIIFQYALLSGGLVLWMGTLTGCLLCREGHPLCRLKNPTVI